MRIFLKKGAEYPFDKIIYVRPNVNPCFKCGNPVIYCPKIEVNDHLFRIIGFTMRSSLDKLHICNEVRIEDSTPFEQSSKVYKE